MAELEFKRVIIQDTDIRKHLTVPEQKYFRLKMLRGVAKINAKEYSRTTVFNNF